ncbi:hypothetical protein IW261DRAFT_1575630 [Armillaria novae-zelandiae]|uniref:Uncharacterized protein n=1 Tax=Armillaria novae-zelandiae TaxID=153914 RepID=A0AA39ND65_9AGAR|nr:hypothetical protein IW261DRAFT_1575630 [Armillaria novae-zelandiae]
MSINVNNALEDQGRFAKQAVEDNFSMPKRLCRHDPEEERVSWPVERVIQAPEDPFCYRLHSFVGEEAILMQGLQEMSNLDIIKHKPGWVYFRGDVSPSLREQLLNMEGIRTFDDHIIIECINVEDELDMEVDSGIHVFELGDWVTPDLGVYQGNVGCIVAIHDWGYDVAFIPQYISSYTADDTPQVPCLMVATRDEAHTLSATGQVGAKPLIEDGLQILEFSPKTIALARLIPAFTVQMFMAPCAHAGPDRANSVQSLVSQSLWKCPRPQEWTFSPADEVSVQAQLSLLGRVIEIQDTGLDIYCLYIGKVCRYGWLDVYKYFRVNNCVKFLSEDNRGSLGCVQCIDDVVAIDVLILPENTKEINVWRNAVALTNPPKAFAALAPEKMYTGKTPWQGINVIVLPSNNSRVTTAHLYKGQVGTVLDVLLKQPGLSSLRVCVRLLQTYRAASGFTDVWLDYDEVVEETTGLPLRGNEQKNVERGQVLAHELAEQLQRKLPPPPRSVTPPYAGPSEDSGTGSAWDPSAPDPVRSHWYQHPVLAQRDLRVNMLGKTQPQKHIFRTVSEEILTPSTTIKPVEPNVCDFHRWIIIRGPGLGKAVCGTRYVEGSKPTKWWVKEVSIQSGKVDEFVGEAWEVVSSDMCVAADSDDDYWMNLSWAQSQREAPVRAPKR